MATSLQAAEPMVLNAARLRDEGRPCLKEASMAKLFASEGTSDIQRLVIGRQLANEAHFEGVT